jgi:phage/plasmid-associated DNA primase
MCKEWMDTPLRPSQAIQEVTDDYRVESDRIQCFLDDVVTPHPTGLVTQNDLWKNYQSWCKANGYKPGVKSIFAKRLSAKNIKAQRRRTGIGAQEEYYYTGYQMIEVEP